MFYRLRKMIALDLLNLILNPTWMCFSILFPLLLIVIVGYMTQNLYGSLVTSYDYYGVTLMIYSALYSGTFSANCFMEEKIKKANLRSVYAPIQSWEIPLSKTVATFLYTLFFYTLVAIFTGVLFSINYGEHVFKLWLLFASINFASSNVGVLMCCIFKSEGIANQILSIVTNIVGITAGLLFPTAALGQTFHDVCSALPLSKYMIVIFELIYDSSSPNYISALIWMSCISLIMIVLTNFFFKGEDYV